MNEAEHLMETQRWLRYAREDLAGAETLLEQRVVVPRHKDSFKGTVALMRQGHCKVGTPVPTALFLRSSCAIIVLCKHEFFKLNLER